MNKQDYAEIERRKYEGGVLWFIEHKETNKWFHYSFEQIDNIPCTCIECFPNGFPFKTTKDGWTSNPMEAQGYLTKKDADDAAFGYFATNEDIDNLVLTEHEFVIYK